MKTLEEESKKLDKEMNEGLKKIDKEWDKLDRYIDRGEREQKKQAEQAAQQIINQTVETFNALPETPKTIVGSMAAGAVIGNIIPIPGVGAGIGALVGGAIGLWRLKNR